MLHSGWQICKKRGMRHREEGTSDVAVRRCMPASRHALFLRLNLNLCTHRCSEGEEETNDQEHVTTELQLLYLQGRQKSMIFPSYRCADLST